MTNKMKTERNRELVRKRDKDPKYWSFGRLGDFYGIRKVTAYQIYKREKQRLASR